MVSIIIPFNNGKRYLKTCLENLSNLQYVDYELILVDDFSNDNSEKIAKEYADRLNIKYYRTTEETMGVGNARNLGLQKANGEYIMFVDVDDIIEKDLLIKLENYMNQKVEMIKYKMKIIYKEKEIFSKGPSFDVISGEEGFNKLCFKDKFLDSPCLYLIKKELLDRVYLRFEKNVYHEDFGFIPQLMVNAKSMVSIDFYGYNYIQSDNSIMRNDDYIKKIKKVENKFFHYDNLLKNICNYQIADDTRQNLLEFYTNSIILSIKELKEIDRSYFEEKIKKRKMIDNFRVKTIKQYLRKIILKNRFDLYLDIDKLLRS